MPARKRPVLAAVANFILPGAGTLYVGQRKRFAVLMMASALLSNAYWIVFSVSIVPVLRQVSVTLVLAMQALNALATLTFSAAFAYDGYGEATRANA